MPGMLNRLSQIYVDDPTEAVRRQREDTIAEDTLEETKGSPHDWRLSLYFGEPCAPAVLVTFDPKTLIPDTNERPAVHVSWEALRHSMKPQYRDAIPLVD